MNHPTDKDAICWNLLQAGTLARKQLQDIAEEYSLTSTLLYALCSLSPKIPASMREISDALICDASNVTGLVDRLMHHGLVERHESADDRRVKEVSLTE